MTACLIGHRVLICDRDGKWTSSVRQLLDTSRIRVVQTPFQAPNPNAYAERFVRSIKNLCLRRVIPLGSGTCAGCSRISSNIITTSGIIKGWATSSSTLVSSAGLRIRLRATRRAPQLVLPCGVIPLRRQLQRLGRVMGHYACRHAHGNVARMSLAIYNVPSSSR
jgi:hypothetical protein